MIFERGNLFEGLAENSPGSLEANFLGGFFLPPSCLFLLDWFVFVGRLGDFFLSNLLLGRFFSSLLSSLLGGFLGSTPS